MCKKQRTANCSVQIAGGITIKNNIMGRIYNQPKHWCKKRIVDVSQQKEYGSSCCRLLSLAVVSRCFFLLLCSGILCKHVLRCVCSPGGAAPAS